MLLQSKRREIRKLRDENEKLSGSSKGVAIVGKGEVVEGGKASKEVKPLI